MVAASSLPKIDSRVTDAGGLITREWRDFFLRLASQTDNAALAEQLTALAARVSALESADDALPLLIGLSSVKVFGTLADGLVQITLEGDTDNPGNTFYYGTGPDGAKGFFRLAGAMEAGIGIVKTDSGYVVLGEVDTVADLPGSGNVGEAWRVLDPEEAGLYAWDGAAWGLDSAATGVVGFRLDELANTGIGASPIKIYTRDAYGRIEGDEDATTDALPEGLSNLYFTAARVRATVLTGISFVTATAITAADTVLSALGKLQAQITALAASVAGLIVQTITNGDTTHAPSGDAVFDALALKADTSTLANYLPLAGGVMTGTVTMGIDDFRIQGNTGSGSDTRRIIVAPAGSITATRGAYLQLCGVNHASTPGQALIVSGVGSDMILTAPLGQAVRPGNDNGISSGSAAVRWSVVYAATGAINTCDAREKSNIRELNAKELAAGLELALMARIYQWNDAIELKGDSARLHCGPTVQGVIMIMESHGLDPFSYGFVCYDQWEEVPEIVEELRFGRCVLRDDPNEVVEYDVEESMAEVAFYSPHTKWVYERTESTVTQEYRPAGSRYSLRPDELAAFRDAALAQNQRAIMDRLAALESE